MITASGAPEQPAPQPRRARLRLRLRRLRGHSVRRSKPRCCTAGWAAAASATCIAIHRCKSTFWPNVVQPFAKRFAKCLQNCSHSFPPLHHNSLGTFDELVNSKLPAGEARRPERSPGPRATEARTPARERFRIRGPSPPPVHPPSAFLTQMTPKPFASRRCVKHHLRRGNKV